MSGDALATIGAGLGGINRIVVGGGAASLWVQTTGTLGWLWMPGGTALESGHADRLVERGVTGVVDGLVHEPGQPEHHVLPGGIGPVYARRATNTDITSGAGISSINASGGGFSGRLEADGTAGIGAILLNGSSALDVQSTAGPVGTVTITGDREALRRPSRGAGT